MAIQLFMNRLLSILLDRFQRVSIVLNVGLKLEFEAALILTVDRDRSLIFALTRLGLIAQNVAIRHKKVARVRRILNAVWSEKELVVAQIELSNVFRFLEFSYFKPKEWLLFGLVVESIKSQLLPPAIADTGCDLSWIHLVHVRRLLD